MFSNWLGVVRNPEKVFAHEKGDAELAYGVVQYALGGLLLGFFLALGWPYASLFSPLPKLAFPLSGTGFLRFGAVPVLFAVSAVVLSFGFSFALFISAKFFKGKGSFEQQYYLTSLYEVPLALASVPLFLISFTPLGGSLPVTIAAVLASVYSLYLLYAALRTAHSLDKASALLAVAIPAALYALVLGFAALIRAAVG